MFAQEQLDHEYGTLKLPPLTAPASSGNSSWPWSENPLYPNGPPSTGLGLESGVVVEPKPLRPNQAGSPLPWVAFRQDAKRRCPPLLGWQKKPNFLLDSRDFRCQMPGCGMIVDCSYDLKGVQAHMERHHWEREGSHATPFDSPAKSDSSMTSIDSGYGSLFEALSAWSPSNTTEMGSNVPVSPTESVCDTPCVSVWTPPSWTPQEVVKSPVPYSDLQDETNTPSRVHFAIRMKTRQCMLFKLTGIRKTMLISGKDWGGIVLWSGSHARAARWRTSKSHLRSQHHTVPQFKPTFRAMRPVQSSLTKSCPSFQPLSNQDVFGPGKGFLLLQIQNHPTQRLWKRWTRKCWPSITKLSTRTGP